MNKYLIIREELVNKEDIEYYLEQNWEIIETFETTYRIGFYCEDLVSFLCNLESDLEFHWDFDSEYLGENWNSFEEWKEHCKKRLEVEKELIEINGYSYFIFDNDMIENLNTYGCDMCGERKDFDKEIIWVTSSYGVCEKCYKKLTEEEIEKIRGKYE